MRTFKCMQPGTEEETVGSGVAVGGLNMAGAGNDPCGTGVGSYCGRKNSYCCPSGLFCDSMRTFKCMTPGTEEETVGSGVAVGGLNMAGAGNDPCGTGVGSYCGRKNSYCCPSGLFCDSMRTFKCMQPGTE